MLVKFNLLLLDANVVIYLFELGLWDTLVGRCDIHLARAVKEESIFWEDDEGVCHNIDWSGYEEAGRITVFDVPLSKVRTFYERFDRVYSEKLDPGETEALAYLVDSDNEECLISSADKIVFRILGNLGLSDRGISLEEIFGKLGMRRSVR